MIWKNKSSKKTAELNIIISSAIIILIYLLR